ncbi:MAG: MerR family DNA-binding transcriptional regulator [Nitriliruptorales bacterium]
MADRSRLLQVLEDWDGSTDPGDEPYFRTGEVATVLRVSVRAIRSWADEGKLRCVRTEGGHRLFPASTVVDALRRMESGSASAP